jgi:signal peptidase II
MSKFWTFSMGVLLLDQASKFVVDNYMSLNQTIPLIEGVFHITYVRNPGAAFGILAGQRLFFVLVTIAVIVMLMVYARQVKENGLLQIAFGLQLGGAVGNLIDRLTHNFVIDYFDFRLISFPVFNIADTAIVIGVALFALDLIMEWRPSRYET